MAIGALLILVFVFVAGASLGSVVTAIVLHAQRRKTVDSPNEHEPPLARDPANPYEPSTINRRVQRSTNGCALAFAVVLIGTITLISFAATFFWAASTTIQTIPAPVPVAPMPVAPAPVAPAPVAPVPGVVNDQQPPTDSALPANE